MTPMVPTTTVIVRCDRHAWASPEVSSAIREILFFAAMGISSTFFVVSPGSDFCAVLLFCFFSSAGEK